MSMLMSYRNKARNNHEAWPKGDYDDASTHPRARDTYKRIIKHRERSAWKVEAAKNSSSEKH
jgi:hypothetical protein